MPEEKVIEQNQDGQDTPEPKPQEPKGPSLERLRELESKYQRELSDKSKALGQTSKEVETLRSRVAELEAAVEEAKLYGDDEEAKQAHRKLRDAERALQEKDNALSAKELRVRASEKALAVWVLSKEFGIPEEELEKCETAEEMRIKTLEWENKQLKGGGKAPEGSLRQAQDRSREKPKAPPENGEQRIPKKSYKDMPREEFLAEAERLKKQALQRSYRS